ncbi:hypothetical protein [Dishui Lake phycodnavirus 2]|nr:hypothetical protein [Dishui Lake phycodnavirus 2]
MSLYFRMSDITTYNLSDPGDGMVSLKQEQPSTAFVADEKNVRKQQKEEEMDSTSIADIMEPEPSPMMMMPAADPRMQGVMPQMVAPQAGGPTGFGQQVVVQEKKQESKNPLNLTDDQMTALFVAACAALAVSKPVQDRLVTSVPKFLNEQGSRSAVGLAATGAVAAVVFYFGKNYVISN